MKGYGQKSAKAGTRRVGIGIGSRRTDGQTGQYSLLRRIYVPWIRSNRR